MHFRTSALSPISIINKDAFPNIFDDASMAAPEMKLGPGNSFIMHSDTGTIYGQLSGRESESMPFPDDLPQGRWVFSPWMIRMMQACNWVCRKLL